MRKKSDAALISKMIVLSLASKVLGLFRTILINVHYGTSPQAIAFWTALAIPNIFLDILFASAISASFIPIFTKKLECEDRKSADRFANLMTAIVFLSSFFLVILMIIFSKNIVMFYDGLENFILASYLLKILAPSVIFSALAFLYAGILQSLGEFLIPQAMSLCSNVIILIYLLFFNQRFGVIGLAFSFLIGWLMQFVMQWPALRRFQFQFSFSFYMDPDIKKVFAMSLPVMLSTWIMPINLLINQKFASRLYQGVGVAVYTSADLIFMIAAGIISLSVSNYIFPKLSKLKAANQTDAFVSCLQKSIYGSLFFVIPLMAGLALLRIPFISFLFQYKNFDEFSVRLTGDALLYYCMGGIPFCMQAILTRAMYAEQKIWPLVISSVSTILCNFLLTRSFVGILQIGGPALANSLSLYLYVFLLLIFLKRQQISVINKKGLLFFLKVFLSTAVMSLFVWLFKHLFIFKDNVYGRFILLFIPSIVGFFTYMIVSYLLRVEESIFVWGKVRKLVKRSFL